MSFYPEVEGRTDLEFTALFDGASADGPEYAVPYYQELAKRLGARDLFEPLWRPCLEPTRLFARDDSPRAKALRERLSHDPHEHVRHAATS